MYSRSARSVRPQAQLPLGFSVLGAAAFMGESERAFAAQVVALAVARVIRISVDEAARPADAADSPAGLVLILAGEPEHIDDKDFVAALFDGGGVGSQVSLRRADRSAIVARLRPAHAALKRRLVDARLVEERTVFERTDSSPHSLKPAPGSAPIVDHLWGMHDLMRTAVSDPSTAPPAEVAARLLPIAVLFQQAHTWMPLLEHLAAKDEHPLPENLGLFVAAIPDLVGEFDVEYSKIYRLAANIEFISSNIFRR